MAITPVRATGFVAVALASALVACLAAAAFNLAIDPYGIYGLLEMPGLNAYKPAKYQRVRLAKAFEVHRVEPRAVVLGTSRSHVGIRPAHGGWDTGAEPRFNLAFDGATTHEMYAYLRDAQAARPLREVILGLDTWQLGTDPSEVRPDFDPMLLDVPGDPWCHLRRRIAQLRILLSIDTLLASMRTVATQDEADADWFAPDGQRLGEVFFRRPGEMFTSDGPGSYFRDIDRQEFGFKLDLGPAPHPRRGTAEAAPDRSSLDYVRLMIDFCREHGIDLKMYITPAHAHQMEISAAVGEWPKIEAGKRSLVRMLAQDAAQHPGAAPFPLWDFSGYSAVTTEPVPPSGSSAEMDFYWDSSHFKQGVGDWVLDRLFGTRDPDHPVPADFGVKLEPGTIDADLARIRGDHAAYRSSHPDDIAAIDAMLADTVRQIPSARRAPIGPAQ